MNQNQRKNVSFGQSTIMEALTIKRGQSSKSIKERLETWVSKRKQKGINAKKHSGVIKLKKDPLEIQKTMRDEWD